MSQSRCERRAGINRVFAESTILKKKCQRKFNISLVPESYALCGGTRRRYGCFRERNHKPVRACFGLFFSNSPS